MIIFISENTAARKNIILAKLLKTEFDDWLVG